MSIKRSAQQVVQSAGTLLDRARGHHVTLAVTGLSRSGKTAFITSLVNQLQQGNIPENLPLFDVVRQRRLLSVKQIAQPHLDIASFRYLKGMRRLSSTPPQWPDATRSISEIRLELRFQPGTSSWLSRREGEKLLLDVVDYPGEWLLDLPMLKMDFQQWSEQQWHLLEQSPRVGLSLDWMNSAKELIGKFPEDDAIHQCADAYGCLLKHFKSELGLSLLQPGRMLLPGELEGTPALAFFPLPKQLLLEEDEASEQLWSLLEGRYQYYLEQVVHKFFKRHFCRFDRQIVLVDCLQPLNNGPVHFREMQRTLEQVLRCFDYGQQGWLRQLVSPKISKLLIAASKSDHVTVEQFSNLNALVSELADSGQKREGASFVETESQALASIRATRFGHVDNGGEKRPAIKGAKLDDSSVITVFPGGVPPSLPDDSFFSKHNFNFIDFAPQPRESNYKALPHIGMDKAMQFLLGDFLK